MRHEFTRIHEKHSLFGVSAFTSDVKNLSQICVFWIIEMYTKSCITLAGFRWFHKVQWEMFFECVSDGQNSLREVHRLSIIKAQSFFCMWLRSAKEPFRILNNSHFELNFLLFDQTWEHYLSCIHFSLKNKQISAEPSFLTHKRSEKNPTQAVARVSRRWKLCAY